MNDDAERALEAFLVAGGVWATASVTDQPSLTLAAWSVRRVSNGNTHFVGWCHENCEGRVSSAIVEFDAQTRRGRTKTGRVYQLAGTPGNDGDAEYVWQRWLLINEESSWTDVTAEVTKT
jgi:hypothetical protein